MSDDNELTALRFKQENTRLRDQVRDLEARANLVFNDADAERLASQLNDAVTRAEAAEARCAELETIIKEASYSSPVFDRETIHRLRDQAKAAEARVKVLEEALRDLVESSNCNTEDHYPWKCLDAPEHKKGAREFPCPWCRARQALQSAARGGE